MAGRFQPLRTRLLFDGNLTLDGQGGALVAVVAGLEGAPAYRPTPGASNLGPISAGSTARTDRPLLGVLAIKFAVRAFV